MRLEGERSDGVLLVGVGAGQCVLLKPDAGLCSPPFDGEIADRYGPWVETDYSPVRRAEVQGLMACSLTVPILTLSGVDAIGDDITPDEYDGIDATPEEETLAFSGLRAAREKMLQLERDEAAAHEKAWDTRGRSGDKAKSSATQRMKQAETKGVRVKTSGGVSRAVDNAAEQRMRVSNRQDDRDAYWRAQGVKGGEKQAAKNELRYLKQRGVVSDGDAKSMLKILEKNTPTGRAARLALLGRN